jgi:replicative DNA helicase
MAVSKDEIKKKMEETVEAEEAKFANNGDGGPVMPGPLSWQVASVGRFISEKPPDPDYLFNKILIRNTVGGVFAPGGTGKSFILCQMACCLATGRSFGIFEPNRANKILYIGCEDPETELWRRIYLIANSMGLLKSKELADNLAVYSGVGSLGALLMMDGQGNPTTSVHYEWLEESIDQLHDLDVLILDPMSRLYGLNENDNAHGTFWIHSLERLSQRFRITILFAHHEAKSASQNKNLRDSMGRGASSIRDGCRWSLSMREMTENDSKKYDVDNTRDYVELDISKANYTAKLPNSVYFKRGEGGLLEPVNLNIDRIKELAEVLVYELSKVSDPISKRDLFKKLGKGKDISLSLKESVGLNHSRDMGNVINYALREGLIFETEVDSDCSGARKSTLRVAQLPSF